MEPHPRIPLVGKCRSRLGYLDQVQDEEVVVVGSRHEALASGRLLAGARLGKRRFMDALVTDLDIAESLFRIVVTPRWLRLRAANRNIG